MIELNAVQSEMNAAMRQVAQHALGREAEAALNARVTRANEVFHAIIHRLADNPWLTRTIRELAG